MKAGPMAKPPWVSHTQAVERAIRQVCDAAKKVRGQEGRDGRVLAQVEGRKLLAKKNTKADLATSLGSYKKLRGGGGRSQGNDSGYMSSHPGTQSQETDGDTAEEHFQMFQWADQLAPPSSSRPGPAHQSGGGEDSQEVSNCKQQIDTADNWAQMEAEMMDAENYLDNALKKDVAEFGTANIKVEEKYVPEKEQIDVGKMTPCEESFKDFVENNKTEVNDENCMIKKDSFVESYLDNAMKKETETGLIDKKPTRRRDSYGKKTLEVVGVADMSQMELVKSGRWGTGKRLSVVEDLLVKNEDGMWQCKPCGKTAKNSGEIRLHAERHIDGLTFECNLCGRSFRSRASLAQHKWSFKGRDVKCNETKRQDNAGAKETPEVPSTRKPQKSKGTISIKQERTTENPEGSPQMESPINALNMNVKQESYVELLAAQGIDIKKSAYFCNTKQSVANGTRIAHLFSEPLPFLPEGWRIRIVEVKSKEKVLKQKQYLSPTNLLFKASLGVIEYLRLEGKFSHEELMSAARSLRVENKVNKLFSSEELASTADPDPAADTTLEQDASEGVSTDSTSNIDNSFEDESNVSEGGDLEESLLTRPQVEVEASSEFDSVLSAADNIIQEYDNNLEELSSYGYMSSHPGTQSQEADGDTAEEAVIRNVQKDGANKGRQFYVCARPREEQCPMFQWADQRAPPSSTRPGPAHQSGGGEDSQEVSNCGQPSAKRTVQKEGSNKGRQFYSFPRDEFFQSEDEVGAGPAAGPALGNNIYNIPLFNGPTARRRGGAEGRGGVKRKAGGGDGGGDKKQRKCGLCREPGHVRTKCPMKSDNSEETG